MDQGFLKFLCLIHFVILQVSTLSSWLSNLINKDANNTISNDISEESERSFVMFPLLKAMGGLLMLPKDMLIDKSLRKEVFVNASK